MSTKFPFVPDSGPDSLEDMVTVRAQNGTAAGLATIGAFQLGLALGAPWGRASHGGAHRGTLPTHLRAISGIAALGYCAGAVLILRGSGSPQLRTHSFTTLAVVMGVGTLANAASRSPIERAIWTPMTALTSVLAWRSRAPCGGPGR